MPIDHDLTVAADSGNIEGVKNNYLDSFFDSIAAQLKDRPSACEALRQSAQKTDK